MLDRDQTQIGRYWLPLIILVATALRVAAAFYLGDHVVNVVNLPGTNDQISCDMLAQRMLNGHGFNVMRAWWTVIPAGAATAFWPYVYTVYLIAVYGLDGYHLGGS